MRFHAPYQLPKVGDSVRLQQAAKQHCCACIQQEYGGLLLQRVTCRVLCGVCI
jgi:hypothetical protein